MMAHLVDFPDLQQNCTGCVPYHKISLKRHPQGLGW